MLRVLSCYEHAANFTKYAESGLIPEDKTLKSLVRVAEIEKVAGGKTDISSCLVFGAKIKHQNQMKVQFYLTIIFFVSRDLPHSMRMK